MQIKDCKVGDRILITLSDKDYEATIVAHDTSDDEYILGWFMGENLPAISFDTALSVRQVADAIASGKPLSPTILARRAFVTSGAVRGRWASSCDEVIAIIAKTAKYVPMCAQGSAQSSGASCKGCGTYNEYINAADAATYKCYSCKSGGH